MANDGKRKNPWGSPGNDDGNRPQGPWGGGGGNSGGGGQEPPDLDEMLRKAQENFRSVMPGSPNSAKFIGFIVIALGALWLASGFYVVNPGEHAVIQRFGAWSRTQSEPGLGYHLPLPLETATVINVEEIRKMTIGFSEAFARGGVAGRRDVPEESLMLTADRNIVDLDLEVQWNIKNSEDFLFNVYDQENTVKKVAESAVREIVGQTNMFPIITTARDAVAAQTKNIIQQNLDEYDSGVNVTQVLIQTAEVHPDVQSAFQDVQSAKQDAEDVQNRAEAYREDILPKARGYAIQLMQEAQAYKQSNVAKAKGDADRFSSVYQAYLGGKEVTKERIYIETMEEVLKNAQKIIMDDKSNNGIVPYLPLNEMKPAAGIPKKIDSASDQTGQ
jgi:modulator of FtsH protease HflK